MKNWVEISMQSLTCEVAVFLVVSTQPTSVQTDGTVIAWDAPQNISQWRGKSRVRSRGERCV